MLDHGAGMHMYTQLMLYNICSVPYVYFIPYTYDLYIPVRSYVPYTYGIILYHTCINHMRVIIINHYGFTAVHQITV